MITRLKITTASLIFTAGQLLAIDPTLPVVLVDGSAIIRQEPSMPNRFGATINYNYASYRWESDGWRQWIQAAPCPEGEMVTNRSWSIDSAQAVEFVQCGPAPYVPAYEGREFEWILLDAHPATNDIPAGGMTYRLSGYPITWWVVRQGDLEATQISAHDEQGRPIYRSRNLGTGQERTINVGALEAAARVTVKATVTNETKLLELADVFPIWQSGIAVSIGELYRHGSGLYRVIQAHTTQSDWTPPTVPALFASVAAPGGAPQPWVQPFGGSGTYTNGSVVTHNGQTWVNTHAAPNLNVWEPGAFGWVVQ